MNKRKGKDIAGNINSDIKRPKNILNFDSNIYDVISDTNIFQ